MSLSPLRSLRRVRLSLLSVWLVAASPIWAAGALGTAEPYAWTNVRIGGGGFVSGLLYHPTAKGVFYARTDVGGAYRWEEDTRRWTPLTDFLGATDVNLTGIESFAIDPNDADRLYLASGTYTNPRSSNGAMFLSRDRGRTFKRVDLPFKLGANEAGRGDGERLCVDPNHGATLLFGSRAAGLWRSDDYGASWQNVSTFPAAATSEGAASTGRWKQPVGIVFTFFDAQSGKSGVPTPVVFAGVATREGGLFRSRDGGATWEALPGQPVGLRPQRAVLASDRWLYLTFGDEPAPNSMTAGAVWRFHLDTSAWEEITPLHATAQDKFGYGGLAVDPKDPAVLLVATFSRWNPGDELFRSRDGGKTWKPVLASSKFDHSSAPWTEESRPHWMADLKIDPTNANRAWFTTGYGVWETRNLAAVDVGDSVAWHFSNDGLEETVPLGLASPPKGAHLLSAVGDLDGYRHDDLAQSPLQFARPPRYSNSEDITFAAQKPEVVARTGTLRRFDSTTVAAAYSLDGARTWKMFATSPAPGAVAGSIAASSDGRIFVWTPRGGTPARTEDFGATWTPCEGLQRGMRVVADWIQPTTFYAFNEQDGEFWHSDDSGSHFVRRSDAFPKPAPTPGGFGGGFRGSATLRVAPGRAEDVWLGFREHGLMHSSDGGAHFAAIPGVGKVFSFGFGHPAPGSEYPAIYLAGVIENSGGLFRSDDVGKSWHRINDDQHQFGWVNHVTGDPRIYGRVYFGTGGRGILYGEPQK